MATSAAVDRPVPRVAVLVPCATLVALAAAMTLSSVALAADGPYYLVRILDSESVFSTDARLIGNALRQLPVLLALKLGATDTHLLSVALGIGQLMLPALIWSAAIVLARGELVAFSAVAMTAGLCAGTTWFCNVGEYVLAMPLIVLVAVLLWRAQEWSWYHTAIALAAAVTLTATYELVVLVSPLLVVWAVWRAVRARGIAARYGAALVAGAFVVAILSALVGVGSRRHQSHTLSLLYYVVSLDPWQFYAATLACVLVVVALTIALERTSLAIAVVAIVCAILVGATFTPDPPDAFKARGGTGIVVLALASFLFVQWARRRKSSPDRIEARASGSGRSTWLWVPPVAFVVAMAYVNIGAIERWNRSLEEFRNAVVAESGTAPVVAAVPRDRRHVVWGWTSASLSLIVRSPSGTGVLFDSNPSFVPFTADQAREQLDDVYAWRS